MKPERRSDEISVEIRDIIGDELDRHPDVITAGDKVANIWGILNSGSESELAQALEVSREDIPGLFDDNIRPEKPIEDRINLVWATLGMLERKIHTQRQRDEFLDTPNPLIRYQKPIRYIQTGRAVDVLLLIYGWGDEN